VELFNSIPDADLNRIELLVFDFDGVFTDNTVVVDSQGVESVTCWRGDGLGLSRMKSLNLKMVIVSTETNSVVGHRANKLGLPFLQSIRDKRSAITEYASKVEVALSNVLFLGNDINDIAGFQIVGYPVAVADANPEVFPFVRYQTQINGGRGAVREICDTIYGSRQKLSN
jgi:3-deoxy-D-manno-octulosonate 8-phosphate phosphatase (KDO 8-P phosphatase)